MEYMLLEIQDKVKVNGESKLTGFANFIEIASFQHGVSNPIQNTTSNTGRTSGRPDLQEMFVTKYLDATTPFLNYHCAKGTDLGTTKIHLVRQDGAAAGPEVNAYDYMVYEMTETMISSTSVASRGEDIPLEQISLNFSEITWTYNPQGVSTGPAGNVPKSWDQKSNTGA